MDKERERERKREREGSDREETKGKSNYSDPAVGPGLHNTSTSNLKKVNVSLMCSSPPHDEKVGCQVNVEFTGTRNKF